MESCKTFTLYDIHVTRRWLSGVLLLMLLFFGGSLKGQDCEADAGMLMPDPAVSDQCIKEGETVTFWGAHIPGAYPDVPPGFKVIYVLTMGEDLVVKQTHKDAFFIVSEAGFYTVHTLVYDPETLDLGTVVPMETTGFDLNALLIQGGGDICASLDVEGASFTVTSCIDECSVNAGKIMTGDPTTICADDGDPDPINVTQMLSDGGTNAAWVITDKDGKILALPAAPPFDLEGSGAGICVIWYLVWDGDILGLEIDKHVNKLEGCFDLSNPIEVERLTGDECEKPCIAKAGKLMIDPAFQTQCLEDNVALIAAAHVPGNDPIVPEGYSLVYLLTKGTDLVIQGYGPDPIFNIIGPDKYTIHTFVFDPNTFDLSDISFGVTTGADILAMINDQDLCADLDVDGAMFMVEECPCMVDAGKISTENATSTCSGDNVADIIHVIISGSTGGNASAWVITDTEGNILSLPEGPIFDFEDAGEGVCLIWYLVYEDEIEGLEVKGNIHDLEGCYDLSNEIRVTRHLVPQIKVSVNSHSDICKADGKNGSATAHVSGGSGQYTFLWSDGQTSATATGLAAGTYSVTATDENGCTAKAEIEIESEASGVCVGDFVWFDSDRDGLQGPFEGGVANVRVQLLQAGEDGKYCTPDDLVRETSTDQNGYYKFCCLEPGEYSIVFLPESLPEDFQFTSPNEGNDSKDSDADVESGKTKPFTITDNDDYSLDAGIYPICANIENGGVIGKDQNICTGDKPKEICASTLPSGGSGTIEYLWMRTSKPGPFDPETWTPIEDADDSCFQPNALYETTYYILCSRRKGCDAYTGESNIVTITVEDCKSGFTGFDANVVNSDEVSLSWLTGKESQNQTYVIERSVNGIDFNALVIMSGHGITNAVNSYRYIDKSPKMGYNFYRIKMVNGNGKYVFSNVADVVVAPEEHPNLIIYPNPVKNNLLTIESLSQFEGATAIELLDGNGKTLELIKLEPGSISQKLNFEKYPSGIYIIMVRYSKSKFDVFKISKIE